MVIVCKYINNLSYIRNLDTYIYCLQFEKVMTLLQKFTHTNNIEKRFISIPHLYIYSDK